MQSPTLRDRSKASATRQFFARLLPSIRVERLSTVVAIADSLPEAIISLAAVNCSRRIRWKVGQI